MDVDGPPIGASLYLPDPMDGVEFGDEGPEGAISIIPGAVPSGQAAAWTRLYLVLDTNVLLDSFALRALGRVRDMFGRGSAGAAGRAFEVMALVPWTVLVELDGLKMGSGGGGDSRWPANGTEEQLQQGACFFALNKSTRCCLVGWALKMEALMLWEVLVELSRFEIEPVCV